MLLFALLWLVMCAFYAVVHPLSTEHTITQGNDSEDALIKGSGNLLHFHLYDTLKWRAAVEGCSVWPTRCGDTRQRARATRWALPGRSWAERDGARRRSDRAV
jgi:hypothetical protein